MPPYRHSSVEWHVTGILPVLCISTGSLPSNRQPEKYRYYTWLSVVCCPTDILVLNGMSLVYYRCYEYLPVVCRAIDSLKSTGIIFGYRCPTKTCRCPGKGTDVFTAIDTLENIGIVPVSHTRNLGDR